MSLSLACRLSQPYLSPRPASVWSICPYSPGGPTPLLSMIGLNEAGFRVAYLPLDPCESGLRMEHLPILTRLVSAWITCPYSLDKVSLKLASRWPISRWAHARLASEWSTCQYYPVCFSVDNMSLLSRWGYMRLASSCNTYPYSPGEVYERLASPRNAACSLQVSLNEAGYSVHPHSICFHMFSRSITTSIKFRMLSKT